MHHYERDVFAGCCGLTFILTLWLFFFFLCRYEGPLDPTQRFPHGAGGQRYNADGSLRESGSFEYGSLHSSQRWRPESLEGNGLSSTGVVHARHTRHRWEGNVLHGKAHGYGEMKYVRETERNTAEESTAAADASATASPAARSSEGASLSPFAQQPRSEFSRYSGHAASGSCFGNGRMEYASGHVYEGAFRDDRHGVGYLLFPDGSLHCGQWSSGRASGLGISWSADGTRRACGWFEEGALVQSQSIPRSLVTDDRFLSKQGTQTRNCNSKQHCTSNWRSLTPLHLLSGGIVFFFCRTRSVLVVP
jgi:hypothetical protein